MSETITLSAASPSDVTVISNIFIDRYMPAANGDCIKVYLYLLRWLSGDKADFSLDRMADTFLMRENDVIRALKYWESRSLLRMSCTSEGRITALTLCRPSEAAELSAAEPAPAPAPSASGTAPGTAAQVQPGSPISVTYPMEQIAAFGSSSEGEQLLLIIQQYLGRPLSQRDLNTIFYFSDGLRFTPSLIEYLFEYCVSGGHTNMRYIETVALSWASQNIRTVSEAKTRSEAYQKACFSVLKAFGISGRMPTAGEAEFVTKWTREYGFSQELILEACRRTIMNVHNPSFNYADKILSNWHSRHLYTMKEIEADDAARSQQKAQEKEKQTEKRQTRPVQNRFHNFKERSYDYSDLEKRLHQKVRTNNSPD